MAAAAAAAAPAAAVMAAAFLLGRSNAHPYRVRKCHLQVVNHSFDAGHDCDPKPELGYGLKFFGTCSESCL